MSNLQYVGARYVPKFYTNPDDDSTNWKSGVEYEPLTVVTYNSNSYTSRKAVPSTIGNPEANSEYWAKTGDFNASLLALQNRVIRIDNSVSELSYISSHNYHKRYILIGDSLGDENHAGEGGHGWCYWFKHELNLADDDCYINTRSGKGWTTETINFLTLAQELEYVVVNPDTITDIIVCGGLNDHSATFNDVYTACNALYDYLHETYVNATIHFGRIGRSRYDSSINQDLFKKITPAVKNSRAKWIEGSDTFGFRYGLYIDTWHWGNANSLTFARALAENFGEKIFVCEMFRNTTFTLQEDLRSSGNNPVPRMKQTGNRIELEAFSSGGYHIDTNRPELASDAAEILLGNVQDTMIIGNDTILIPVSGQMHFSLPTSNYTQYHGYLKFTPDGTGGADVKLVFSTVYIGDTSYVSRTVEGFTIIYEPQSIDCNFC